MKNLTPELKALVHQSVRQFGLVVRRELGEEKFRRIERIRRRMVNLRDLSLENSTRHLETLYRELAGCPADERLEIARAFTLMLELMNACENAYRSHRLSLKPRAPEPAGPKKPGGPRPAAVVYVLTAHPTEARSPQNISAFHAVQDLLQRILGRARTGMQKEPRLLPREERELFHLLALVWHTGIVRKQAPHVKDEAEHIYSLILRDEVLFTLLDMANERDQVPLFIRTWVGGDKDGHPGVDDKVMRQSLGLARKKLLAVFRGQLQILSDTAEASGSPLLRQTLARVKRRLPALNTLKAGDGARLHALHGALRDFRDLYEREFGALHPALRHALKLLHVFPALVVPLELRESSDVLMSEPATRPVLAIDRMLRVLGQVSRGGDPRWYARGFIISMTHEARHMIMAFRRQKNFLKERTIPVIPLFEDAAALKEGPAIMREILRYPPFRKAAETDWNRLVEMMVGYSDSSKESGALYSRVAIAGALPRLEAVCRRLGFTAVFFHGSGGSVDRGGGSIDDQIAWWPKSALKRYKVTVQGEMIDRSLATPEIARRQVEKIIANAAHGLARRPVALKSPALVKFAGQVAAHYRSRIVDAEFLRVAELATPYSYLNLLRIGSRPSKRAGQLSVQSLRAIPWVLCWTQTRMLFQTWWGFGRAWSESSAAEKRALKKAFAEEAVFRSYIKALGFTLAKVELPVWRVYLNHGALRPGEAAAVHREFAEEFTRTLRAFREITGESDPLWFRPWLGQSIHLRSAMIHPLNLLQILAQQEDDADLLRVTVTGISSGMLTTG